MSHDLRKHLGKSNVESQTQGTTAESNTSQNGQRDRRYLVIIDSQRSPVDEAETLQELANLPSVPETTSAKMASDDDGPASNNVKIANVSYDGMRLLMERTEFTEVSISVREVDTLNDTTKTAVLVRSVKERWTKTHTGPWPPELWAAADEARRRGEIVPEPRYPVVISDSEEDGPITDPGALQRLLELPDVPPVTVTTVTDLDGNLRGDQIRVADVDWYQPPILAERAKTERIYVWFYDVRARKTIPRVAYVVKSIIER